MRSQDLRKRIYRSPNKAELMAARAQFEARLRPEVPTKARIKISKN